jgi:hypothetical protein
MAGGRLLKGATVPRAILPVCTAASGLSDRQYYICRRVLPQHLISPLAACDGACIHNVLPKYRGPTVEVGDDEYSLDIERIMAAYKTDSVQRKKILVEATFDAARRSTPPRKRNATASRRGRPWRLLRVAWPRSRGSLAQMKKSRQTAAASSMNDYHQGSEVSPMAMMAPSIMMASAPSVVMTSATVMAPAMAVAVYLDD